MSHQVEIYLVRHSEPLIEVGTCYGQLDCGLTEAYPKQLSKVSTYFKDKSITAIYSSPLQRCALLAEDLAKQHIKDTVVYNELLKEINFGDWEGVKWDDIPRNKIDEWNSNRLNFQFPNGETPSQFHSRTIQFWGEFIKTAKNLTGPQKIVLVTHAGVIRSILSYCLHIPFEFSTQLRIDYATVSKLQLQQHVVECHFINRLLTELTK
ncbi:MAG: alpha-ribazole phosphatase [Psychromonas sp.]|nr:alpha-ribazole phosphatase [Alteromonadales bacterium]MCP5077800.1 alpha-ribazole phosphatase [Psychromonas sp.]